MIDDQPVDPVILVHEVMYAAARARNVSPYRDELVRLVETHGLLGSYNLLTRLNILPSDEAMRGRLEKVIDEKLVAIDGQLADETKSEFDKGLLKLEKAQIYAAACMPEQALEVVADLTKGIVSDDMLFSLRFSLLRCFFALNDWDSYRAQLELCGRDLESANYENRANFKLYEAVAHIVDCTGLDDHLTLEKLATNLKDIVPVYSAEAFIPYPAFVVLAYILNLVALPRKDFLHFLTSSTDALSVVSDIPPLMTAIGCVRDCNYSSMNTALLALDEYCRTRYLLNKIRATVCRSFRRIVIRQFLTSYMNANISSMATTFQISERAMLSELEAMILHGALDYKIDLCAGVLSDSPVDGYSAACADFIQAATKYLKTLESARKSLLTT
ncbi:26S proteasome non-ATPase regulatory subunit 6 [Giardia muris]|uniref:26S proteasome non-ATPase regulatory subunit 6 n=1 Tax=Giardia muris TaxID=5742 RepID=A0A4Z1TCS4_GIAMU|nr:26S proteasome non-ATPase regulatory subunit 6 [Giardia muris]|eukprot:TNJ30389.1 26S proteasome non-ATPase regulatory subunit 6 [Giardia muris]